MILVIYYNLINMKVTRDK